ncbi:trypsin eta-like [Haematobia irritans]|uniref:trypsin eta-like n=1 Tax=Haematobia irritans TaxID=7368 RepID=UPI003F4F874C
MVYKSLVFVVLFTVTVASTWAAATSEGRIIGGRAVTIAKHPYQISLRYKTCDGCTFMHACGGVIYNERTILTAAHCVYQREANSFVVVAGSDNRSGADGFIGIVEKVVVHEAYSPALTDNDIAVVFLATPLDMNLYTIKSAKLAVEEPKAGSKAILSGWGTTSEGGANSLKLQEVEVNIIDHSQCEEAYGFDRITESMLCAGVAAGGRDACQNDSGGPLMNPNNELVGIISWGTGCGRPEYPGVYANVVYFGKWIENVVQEN